MCSLRKDTAAISSCYADIFTVAAFEGHAVKACLYKVNTIIKPICYNYDCGFGVVITPLDIVSDVLAGANYFSCARISFGLFGQALRSVKEVFAVGPLNDFPAFLRVVIRRCIFRARAGIYKVFAFGILNYGVLRSDGNALEYDVLVMLELEDVLYFELVSHG